MANVSEIKRGQVISWKGGLWVIKSFQHVSPGKGSAFTRIKLKNIADGKVVENTFKSTETLDFVRVDRKNMQYLYGDENGATFMDMVSYEQVQVDSNVVGDEAKYLKEGLQVNVAMHGDSPIALELPKKVEYEVAEADPAVKGDTVSGNVLKDSKMKNGLKVRVPIFIKVGDKILVNTENGDYSERVQ